MAKTYVEKVLTFDSGERLYFELLGYDIIL